MRKQKKKAERWLRISIKKVSIQETSKCPCLSYLNTSGPPSTPSCYADINDCPIQVLSSYWVCMINSHFTNAGEADLIQRNWGKILILQFEFTYRNHYCFSTFKMFLILVSSRNRLYPALSSPCWLVLDQKEEKLIDFLDYSNRLHDRLKI